MIMRLCQIHLKLDCYFLYSIPPHLPPSWEDALSYAWNAKQQSNSPSSKYYFLIGRRKEIMS